MSDKKRKIFEGTLTQPFDHDGYVQFLRELLDNMQIVAPNKEVKPWNTFSAAIDHYRHIGNYTGEDKNKVALFSVCLKNDKNLENARSMQRAFVKTLLENSDCAGALVAFYTKDDLDKWRLSLVRMDYEFSKGKLSTKLTPAKRYSYLVGKGEPCHTAQERLYPIFVADNIDPSLDELEEAFSVEAVTKDFFDKYREKYLDLKEYLDGNSEFVAEAESRGFDSEQFSKKLMGQIVFLYFIQKKGWLGVNAFPFRLKESEYKNAFFRRGQKPKQLMPYVYKQAADGFFYRDNNAVLSLTPEDETELSTLVKGNAWGEGPKDFMRQIFEGCKGAGKNFFDDYLEPLFYTGLNQNRGDNAYFPPLHRRIPFLNGGLFEEMEGYDWRNNDFSIPNELFSNIDEKGKRDADGILDVFDRYNFTMAEDEPMEREVAIDPEMLGKVFENLLDVSDRKSKGAFYTPREIVHYMCQATIINYLASKTNIPEEDIRKFIIYGEYFRDEDTKKTLPIENETGRLLQGDEIYYYKHHMEFDRDKDLEIPETIFSYKKNVNRLIELDNLLANVKVVDPAVGSGAFPVGMLNEIVKARDTITNYLIIEMNRSQRLSYRSMRTIYRLKRETIKNCIFACDIEPSAVDITKLRLWLSLVIDNLIMTEENAELGYTTKPRELPNLDCNIICGNSLMDEFEGIRLLTENAALHNESQNRQTTTFDQGLEVMINELIDLQSKLYDEKDHVAKDSLKGQIQDIYNQIVLEQIKGNSRLVDDYYRAMQLPSKPFVLWQLYFPRVFRDNGGFDIAIGNPPYIGFHNVPDKEYYKRRYYSANGKYDFYVLFIEHGLNLAAPSGIVSYICPSYFYKRNYGKNVRTLLLKNASIKYIADFSDYQIFDSALTYTCIFGAQKGNNPDNKVKVLNVDLSEEGSHYVAQSELKEPSWNLEKADNNTILEKLLSKSAAKFGEITKSISQGIVTGFNDIYYIHRSTIENNHLEWTYFEKAYKGKDIRSTGIINSEMYLFYPYVLDSKGKTVPVDETELQREAPNTYKYLLSKKDELLSRDYFVKSSKKWYELWNPRKKEHFYNRKFVFAEIGLVNDFVLVDKCYYTDSACGAELKKEYEKYYPYLRLYLNSNVATYIYKKISVPKANGYSIYKNAFLKEMPIVFPDKQAGLSEFENMSQDDFNRYLYQKLELTESEIQTVIDSINELRGV